MRYFGWFVVALIVLGTFDIIDFHLCVGPAGSCEPQQHSLPAWSDT